MEDGGRARRGEATNRDRSIWSLFLFQVVVDVLWFTDALTGC